MTLKETPTIYDKQNVYFGIFVNKVVIEIWHEGFLVLVIHEPKQNFHAEVLGLLSFDD
jgi:hypothetical protein